MDRAPHARNQARILDKVGGKQEYYHRSSAALNDSKRSLDEPGTLLPATIHYEQCDVNKEPSGCDIDMKFNGLYEKAAAKAICR